MLDHRSNGPENRRRGSRIKLVDRQQIKKQEVHSRDPAVTYKDDAT